MHCVRQRSLGRRDYVRRFYAEYLLCAAAILLLCGSGVLGAQTIAKELPGKLVVLNGRITGPSNNPAVGQAKYIALYYGAGWCGPCHKFTPDLVAFYNEMKPKCPDFEVVFVSRDSSAAEMDNYMAEMKMPWPALRYDAVKWTQS